MALHLVFGIDNDGRIYVLNHDVIGTKSAQSSAISQIVSPAGASSNASSALAFFGKIAFSAASGATIKAFTLADGALTTSAVSQTNTTALERFWRADFDFSGTEQTAEFSGRMRAAPEFFTLTTRQTCRRSYITPSQAANLQARRILCNRQFRLARQSLYGSRVYIAERITESSCSARQLK